ncbi:MAG: hypothetical protein JW867_04865, partial [Candidatus Omnitrophica bacterium]|nr:hypothetical protein [Candidatus Omnitrophota bacterium]
MYKKINFLQINASDLRWGASIAGYRFHKGLLKQGYGSRIICALKESTDEEVSSIIPGRFGYIPNALCGKFFNFLGFQSFGYPSSFFLKNSPWIKRWADVLILRNLHWWYFSISILPWLSKQIPLIWRIPDMWPITGKCIYPYECERWQQSCGRCPHLREYPGLVFDTSSFLLKRKERIYNNIRENLILVSPSRWLKDKIERSPLTKGLNCEVIASAVEQDLFKPGDKESCRRSLGFEQGEKVIML